MHLPDFDHSKMHWDAWGAFHVDHKYSTFYQFDTGEFVVCYRNWRPDERKVYSDLHIQIVATGDDACPRLYVPGKDNRPIPKSHLNNKGGMQTLLLDLDSKRVVGLYPSLTQDNAPSLIPERFLSGSGRSITAYYAGPKATPVGAPIVRHYPQPLTYDQRKHIGELTDACKVWLQMQHDPVKPVRWAEMLVLDFVETRFSDLTTDQRTTIALRGFDMIVREEHDWLRFD